MICSFFIYVITYNEILRGFDFFLTKAMYIPSKTIKANKSVFENEKKLSSVEFLAFNENGCLYGFEFGFSMLGVFLAEDKASSIGRKLMICEAHVPTIDWNVKQINKM